MKKKKILYISASADRGGSEKHLLLLLKYIDKDKYDLSLVIFQDGPLVKEYRNIIDDVRVIDFRSKLSWKKINEIIDIMKEVKPDIVHTHQPKAHFYALLAINKLDFKPFKVATFHGLSRQFRIRDHNMKSGVLQYMMYLFVDRYTLNNIDRVITVSRNNARILERLVQHKDRIALIPNGVEIIPTAGKKTRIKSLLGLEKKKIIGTVARLSYEKGVDRLINAAFPILRQDKDCHLLIVGYGSEKNSLKKLVRDIHIDKQVTFQRIFSPIEDIFPVFDVYVQPSRIEGLSLALLQALSSGLAVVATNAGGNKEVVINNETGILVPNSDRTNQMTSSIETLLLNEPLALTLSKKARVMIKNDYDIEKIVKQVEHLYDSL